MRSFALMLTLLLAADVAAAQAGIRVTALERVRVDGALGDWRGVRFTQVGRGRDASMQFALGNDERGLYVAARVMDDRMVRTATPGAREDAVILTLALPRGRRRQAVDIFLYAGVTGRSAASASLAPLGGRARALSNARVVEGPLPRGSGYVLEAFIPFASIPNGARWDSARASIRLRDVDSEAHPTVESEPALVEVDRRHLDRLVPLMPSGGASGALEQFLASRGLGAARPSHDLRGDVAGDAQPERVFVVNRFVLVTGPGYRNGSYAFHQLAIDRASDVRSAALHDLTGDGKRELVIVLRQRNQQGERDVWTVVALSGESPRPIFGIEVRKAASGGSIEAQVRLHRGRGSQPAEIEHRSVRATGLDRASYHESPATDFEPILLPWGPVSSARYRWNGRTFVRVSQRENPRYVATPPPSARPSTRATIRTPRRPAAPAARAQPTQTALLDSFRQEQGIRRGARPRFRFRANFIGAAAPETAQVFGRRLVVVGPDVQGGRSWFSSTIAAERDEDLLQVRAADVTGDGRSEFLFSVRQTFGDVTRTILIVHQLNGRGFPRLLQVEIARHRGDEQVVNEVRTAGGRLEIRPGRARGFGASNWPYTRDPNDSAQPLLLPWTDRAARYTFRGGRLRR